jgi:hypothetical protein
MTRDLFDDLKPFLDADAEGDAKEFGLALGSILRTKCGFATGEPGNSDEVGDIYRIPHLLCAHHHEQPLSFLVIQ